MDQPTDGPPRRERRRAGDYDLVHEVADLAARTGVLERGMAEIRAQMQAANEAITVRFTSVEQHLLKQDLLYQQWQEQATRQHQEMLSAIDGGIKAMAVQIKEEIREENLPHNTFIDTLEGREAERERREQARELARQETNKTVLGILISLFLMFVAGGLSRYEVIPVPVYFGVMALVALGILALVRRLGHHPHPEAPERPELPEHRKGGHAP